MFTIRGISIMSLILTSSKIAKRVNSSKLTRAEEDFTACDASVVWTEKYKPKSMEDIPIHSTKVRN